MLTFFDTFTLTFLIYMYHVYNYITFEFFVLYFFGDGC